MTQAKSDVFDWHKSKITSPLTGKVYHVIFVQQTLDRFDETAEIVEIGTDETRDRLAELEALNVDRPGRVREQDGHSHQADKFRAAIDAENEKSSRKSSKPSSSSSSSGSGKRPARKSSSSSSRSSGASRSKSKGKGSG